MKMKTFNLTQALAGNPVQTLNGKRVTQITLFEDIDDRYPVRAVVDRFIGSFSIDGKSSAWSELNLFMSTENETI